MARYRVIVLTDDSLSTKKEDLLATHLEEISRDRIIEVRAIESIRMAAGVEMAYRNGFSVRFFPRGTYSGNFPTEEEVREHSKPWRVNRFIAYSDKIEDFLVASSMLVSGFRNEPPVDAIFRSYKRAKSRNECVSSLTARELEIPVIDF